MEMEMQTADIVILGAGIAGLSTAVGLYRLGIKSLVLERSSNLRVTGFAFTSWNNAWKAFDALGLGDLLRQNHPRQQSIISISATNGKVTSQVPLISSITGERDYAVRICERQMLVETLANELPEGNIRFSSNVVSIEDADHHMKLLHLDDGSTLKTKVLLGCDGINSIVARWLGLKQPQPVGKSAIRGHVRTPVEPKITKYMGDGVKYGVAPIDDSNLYWFLVFKPSRCTVRYKEVEQNPEKMKEFVLSRLGLGSSYVRELVEKTDVNDMICSPLKTRLPWEALWGDIAKGNVCVAGDAFHPMTSDLGQGACSALEDGVILARCLGRAILRARQDGDDDREKEYQRINKGLEEYVKKRRWRAFALMATSYLLGSIHMVSWKPLQWLRDYLLAPYLNRLEPKMGDYDCGQLS